MPSRNNLSFSLWLLHNHHTAVGMMSTVVTYTTQNSPAQSIMCLAQKQVLVLSIEGVNKFICNQTTYKVNNNDTNMPNEISQVGL